MVLLFTCDDDDDDGSGGGCDDVAEKEYVETQTPLMSFSNYGDPHLFIPSSSSSPSPPSPDQRFQSYGFLPLFSHTLLCSLLSFYA